MKGNTDTGSPSKDRSSAGHSFRNRAVTAQAQSRQRGPSKLHLTGVEWKFFEINEFHCKLALAYASLLYLTAASSWLKKNWPMRVGNKNVYD